MLRYADEARWLKNSAAALPHVEGCTYLALGHLDRATVAFTSAVDGTRHAVGCSVENFGHLMTAQPRSVSVLARLAPLQAAPAARRDSACQDLASQLATLRNAA